MQKTFKSIVRKHSSSYGEGFGRITSKKLGSFINKKVKVKVQTIEKTKDKKA